MKALLYCAYGGPEVLRLTEFHDPSPGPGEMLIRIRAASVGPGDCKLRAGLLQAHFSISFPKISAVVADQDVVIDTQGGDVHARSYRVLKAGGRPIWFNRAPTEDRAAQY